MYFSKVTLHRSELAVGALARLLRGDGYRTHRQLWALFGDSPERRRDFLYRQEEGGDGPLFYVVSAREPQRGETPWNVETKPYDPRVQTGDRLAFQLRVNPVRSRPKAQGQRGRRHDVVMDAKRRLREQGEEPAQETLIRSEGLAWLDERAGRHGFSLHPEALRIHSYRQQRLYKPRRSSGDGTSGSTKQGNQPIRFSTLDYDGLLTVSDPSLFRDTLEHGLGPAKGFGCGLLLVRRV